MNRSSYFDWIHRKEIGITACERNKPRPITGELISRLQLDRRLKVHNGCINTIYWNSTGNYILSGSDDTNLTITCPYTGRVYISVNSDHSSNIFCARFLPQSNDNQVISCSGDGMIINTYMNRVGTHDMHKFTCNDFTTYKIETRESDPYTFLTCSEDQTVRLFDIRIKTSCTKPNCKDDILLKCGTPATSIACSPTKPHLLAVACADGVVKLYDIRTLSKSHTGYAESEVVSKIQPSHFKSKSNKCRPTSLYFSDNGEELLCNFSNEHIYLYSVEDYQSNDVVPSEDDADGGEDLTEGGSSEFLSRLRVRGDWSDTGPEARPNSGDIPQTTLMSTMARLMARMLQSVPTPSTNDPELANRGSSENEDNQDDAEAENSADVSTEEIPSNTEYLFHKSQSVSNVSQSEDELSFLRGKNDLNKISKQKFNKESCNCRTELKNMETDGSNTRDRDHSTTHLLLQDQCRQFCSDALCDRLVDGESSRDSSQSQVHSTDMKERHSQNDPRYFTDYCHGNTDLVDINRPTLGNSVNDGNCQDESNNDAGNPNFSVVSEIKTECPNINECALSPGKLEVSISPKRDSHSLDVEVVPESFDDIDKSKKRAKLEKTEKIRQNCDAIDCQVDCPANSRNSDDRVDISMKNSVSPNSDLTYRTQIGNDVSMDHAAISTRRPKSSLHCDVNKSINDPDTPSSSSGIHSQDTKPKQATAKNRKLFMKLRQKFIDIREKERTANDLLPSCKLLQVYKGHRHVRTVIKQANFWGKHFIVSGSDCGHVFVWNKHTGELQNILIGDKHVVNCVQPHPYDPLLASSGIDYDIKLFSPISENSTFPNDAEEILKVNHDMLNDYRNTITVPPRFLFQVFRSINAMQRRQQNVADVSGDSE